MILGGELQKREEFGPFVEEPAPLPAKNDFSTAFQQRVCLDTYPVLASHMIEETPVVPFALMAEWFAHGAEYTSPGLYFSGLDDMRLLKGIKPGTEPVDIDIQTGRCTLWNTGDKAAGGNRFETPVQAVSKTRSGTSFTHAGGVAILREALPSPPALDPAVHMELAPFSISVDKAYDTLLFHGEKFKGIKAVTGCSDRGIEITASRAKAPSAWIKKPFAKRWRFDPLLLDAAFQAAILWSVETTGKACLPAYMANFRIYSSFTASGAASGAASGSASGADLGADVKIIFTVNDKSHHRIKGYFTFIDGKGKVIASITGFEAVVDPNLGDKFKPGKKEIFTRDQILAFAQGNPSEAFGEKYKIFDEQREIARLPRPPYFFIDRITKTEPVQWEMTPGEWIEAQFDLPANGWYFAADRSDHLPLCILVEIALQPCGWLAAYAGSALESDQRLFFRNLGGSAQVIQPIHKDMGTLTMRAAMTNVSRAGGMIIQDFAMEVQKEGKPLYKDTTNFGFFTQQALARQTGIKDSPFDLDLSNQESNGKSGWKPVHLKDQAPVTPDDPACDDNSGMPSKALCMVDTIELLLPRGGELPQRECQGHKNR